MCSVALNLLHFSASCTLEEEKAIFICAANGVGRMLMSKPNATCIIIFFKLLLPFL